MTFNKAWFPGSVNARTPFGWDARSVPGYPRIHLGQDYASLNGKREITKAYTVIKGSIGKAACAESRLVPGWIIDGQGNSVLRQFSGDFEIRYYHFKRSEMSSEIIAAVSVPGTYVDSGREIGPSSNVGLSVPGNGNDGSHVHLVIVCKEEKTVNLTPLLGEGWAEDLTEKYSLEYGDAFTLKANEWRVRWMNDKVIYRFDPLSQRYVYFLNPKIILGA